MLFTKNLSGNHCAIILSLITALSIYCMFRVSDYLVSAQFYTPAVQNISPVFPTETPTTKQPPTSIFIPVINKRHIIQTAIVKDNNWQLFDKSVAWLSTSAVPGEGNVILYAHNWKNLWGDLYKVQPGDSIEVKQNDVTHTYIVTESRAVLKTDVNAVLTSENRLTLYTCEGTFDQRRRLVFAIPL